VEEHGLGVLRADGIVVGAAGGGEVHQGHALLGGQFLHLRYVLREADVELAGGFVIVPASHGGDQDGCCAALACAVDVRAQVFLVVGGGGVAVVDADSGVVVPELDHQVIARVNDPQDLVQPALADEVLGAAAPDGVVLERNLLVEVAVDHLAPPGLGCETGVVGLDR
jgi:hypothetical protein